MTRPIDESVVVITGASSGIGRVSAERFAGQGATVVLAARREGALRDVARRCERDYFQLGALGGATAEEFHRGGPRVPDYLERYGSHVRRWDSPGGEVGRPEAE